MHIIKILNKFKFGIDLKKLEKELRKFQPYFDPRTFGAENFQIYLVENLEEYVSIELKRGLNRNTTFMVCPKLQ